MYLTEFTMISLMKCSRNQKYQLLNQNTGWLRKMNLINYIKNVLLISMKNLVNTGKVMCITSTDLIEVIDLIDMTALINWSHLKTIHNLSPQKNGISGLVQK